MTDSASKQKFSERPAMFVVYGITILFLAEWLLNGDAFSELPRWGNIFVAAMLVVSSIAPFACAIAQWRAPDNLNSTWSPFQSSKVREICAHLTPEEHARLIDDARQFGSNWGLSIVGPPAVSSGLFVMAWQLGLALQMLVIIYIVVFGTYTVAFGYPRFRGMLRRRKKQLCETEWAQSQGYEPESLRLMAFPWSK